MYFGSTTSNYVSKKTVAASITPSRLESDLKEGALKVTRNVLLML